MTKTTNRTAAVPQLRLLQIQPTKLGSGGGPTGPDPEAATAPPIFEKPDFAPQLTFIAQASPTDNGFITLAGLFHKNSGMNPITITSIEELVEMLADPTKTGTGLINRMRLVTHVFFDPTGLINPINMLLPFLRGGSLITLRRFFEGFAGTSMDALRSMMIHELGSFTKTTYFMYNDDASALMRFLKSPTHDATLALIPTDAFGEPTGQFNDFFKICGSKWALSMGVIQDASTTALIQQAYDLLLADVMKSLSSTIPESKLTPLRDAIVNFGTSKQPLKSVIPTQLATYVQNLKLALVAVHNDKFLKMLNRVRLRFNANSKVDIRGCQVGQEQEFLLAVQRFFGTSATVRPAVSGPLWFQHFFKPAFKSASANNNLVTLASSGLAPYSASKMRQFFDAWATGFGITDAHLTFWQTTLGLNALKFSALQWQKSLPPTKIPVTRLEALSTAVFSAALTRLADIFLTKADLPNSAALSSITPLLPNLNTWETQLDATVADSATPTELNTHFDNLKSIYEKVDNRFTGTSSPSGAQRIIPSAPPATMNAKTIRDFQTALKTFIDTHPKSRFLPIKKFLNKTLARTQDSPAKMRYFLCLGLPVLAHNPGATNVNNNFLVVFVDSGITNLRQDDAVKYWIRAHWRGIIPSGLGAGTTFADSTHAPWLVEKHHTTPNVTNPPFVISPTDEFQDRIVTVSP